MNKIDVGMNGPKNDSPMLAVVQQLVESQYDMKEKISELEKVLGSVMRPGPLEGSVQNDLSSNVMPSVSPLMAQIGGMLARERELIKKLNEIMNRLDV